MRPKKTPALDDFAVACQPDEWGRHKSPSRLVRHLLDPVYIRFLLCLRQVPSAFRRALGKSVIDRLCTNSGKAIVHPGTYRLHELADHIVVAASWAGDKPRLHAVTSDPTYQPSTAIEPWRRDRSPSTQFSPEATRVLWVTA
jgi:hypothetical protein